MPAQMAPFLIGALAFAILYGVVGLLVGMIVRVIDDPYGHFSPAQDWRQAIFYGDLWFPMFCWMLLLLAYDFLRSRLQ